MERLVGKGQNKIIILALLFLGWMVSYLDRVSINIAMVQIGEEFQLGPEAYGTVLSIFSQDMHSCKFLAAGWQISSVLGKCSFGRSSYGLYSPY